MTRAELKVRDLKAGDRFVIYGEPGPLVLVSEPDADGLASAAPATDPAREPVIDIYGGEPVCRLPSGRGAEEVSDVH